MSDADTVEIFEYVKNGLACKSVTEKNIEMGLHDNDKDFLEFYRQTKKKLPYRKDQRELAYLSYEIDKCHYKSYLENGKKDLSRFDTIEYCPPQSRAVRKREGHPDMEIALYIGIQIGNGAYARFQVHYKLKYPKGIFYQSNKECTRPFSQGIKITYLRQCIKIFNPTGLIGTNIDVLWCLEHVELFLILHKDSNSWLSHLSLDILRVLFYYVLLAKKTK